MKKEKSGVWKKGDVIYNINDPSKCAYLIVSGRVSIFSSSGLHLGDIGPDEVFGEISCYMDKAHSVSATAASDCVAVKIPKEELKRIIRNTHPVIMGMLRSTYLRLSDSNQKSEIYAEEVEKLTLITDNISANSDEITYRIKTLREKVSDVKQNKNGKEKTN